jgi:hypothetical protein
VMKKGTRASEHCLWGGLNDVGPIAYRIEMLMRVKRKIR